MLMPELYESLVYLSIPNFGLQGVGLVGGDGQTCRELGGYPRPAASTLCVGSAPCHVTSAVGPYEDGTLRPSNRRFTVNWLRWWAVCSTRRQKIQMRSRSTSKNRTRSSHQPGGCAAKKARRGRASSARRVAQAMGDPVCGRTSPAGGSGTPMNSPKKRRSESNWCFRISATELARGCGR